VHSLPSLTNFHVHERANENLVDGPAYVPTATERARLTRINAQDIRLFTAATQRFESEWARMLQDSDFPQRRMRYVRNEQPSDIVFSDGRRVEYDLVPAPQR
jgi:hypothetical protein